MLTIKQYNTITKSKNSSIQFMKNKSTIKISFDQISHCLELTKDDFFIRSFNNLEELNKHLKKYDVLTNYIQV